MSPLWIYGGAMALFMAWYLGRRASRARRHAGRLAQAQAAGLTEPASLHPVIDPLRCIGSGTCASACPEKAIAIVDNKAVLADGSACIGHGACLAACPVDAIRLVFGTEQRGVDIPQLSASFETSVPGIFIAGELGGMGLIRKAAEQGRQAIDAIRRRKGRGDADLDVVIVGAGPAGLSAGLSAKAASLRYRVIEQETSLGGAIYHYPRNKIAMTAPIDLALVGKVRMGEISKEALLAFWNGTIERTRLEVSLGERMEAIAARADGTFDVRTSRGTLHAASVLLAIGRRGTPRKLDVPGETLPKVVYRLVDAQQYRGRRVLVVGGGDSALEAAIALADVEGCRTTLSYRRKAFDRVKARNREQLAERARAGRLRLMLESEVQIITPDAVRLRAAEGFVALPNDAVVICAGGTLPTPLLREIGIRFETRFGTA
ncbi:MAG: NAD(P)-binding domain-containing protein [Lautropia sp.]